MSNFNFHSEALGGRTLLRWLDSLDSGERAALRRAAALTDVVLTPAFQRLYQDIARHDTADLTRDWRRDRLATLAGLVALQRDEAPGESLPQTLSARSNTPDNPVVSPLRFRRLLEVRDMEELFRVTKRVLPIINYKFNAAKLANDIWFWGEDVRKRWAYDYRWPGGSSAEQFDKDSDTPVTDSDSESAETDQTS